MSALDKAWSLLKNEQNPYPFTAPQVKPNTMQQPPPMKQVPCPHCNGSGVTQQAFQYSPYYQNPNKP